MKTVKQIKKELQSYRDIMKQFPSMDELGQQAASGNLEDINKYLDAFRTLITITSLEWVLSSNN